MAVKADPAEKQPQSTAKNGKDEAKIKGQTTAKSGLPVCINKDLLAHGHAFIFILSVAAVAELSSCSKDRRSYNTEIFTIWNLQKFANPCIRLSVCSNRQEQNP